MGEALDIDGVVTGEVLLDEARVVATLLIAVEGISVDDTAFTAVLEGDCCCVDVDCATKVFHLYHDDCLSMIRLTLSRLGGCRDRCSR